MIGLLLGSGMQGIELAREEKKIVETPFGNVEVRLGDWQEKRIAIIDRHGPGHCWAPHQIPSRAQIVAMREVGVTHILASATVGGLSAENAPGHFAVPDQVIDYTWGRPSTYWGEEGFARKHIDFTQPFDADVREAILAAATELKIYVHPKGCYACTQGPRLETAAEVRRMIMDGADMVGMTAMPEAALARELDIAYGVLTASVNWGAGLAGAQSLNFQEIRAMMKQIANGMTAIFAQVVRHSNF